MDTHEQKPEFPDEPENITRNQDGRWTPGKSGNLKGKPTYDVAADFAVSCANCHRVIHRSDDPSDLNKFRAVVQSNKI